jgi:hypothetical protein
MFEAIIVIKTGIDFNGEPFLEDYSITGTTPEEFCMNFLKWVASDIKENCVSDDADDYADSISEENIVNIQINSFSQNEVN